MSLRIDRIKVNRGGPLDRDFEFEPGDLNLICGRNETGKTYVVESLIRFLFKTTGRAPVAAGLRDWDVAGRAIVSGLEAEPVSFTKSGSKLEDYWQAETGLPTDLSRLLVVRAGETLLAQTEHDGVGRKMLKDYLSGEGLLDRIAGRISRTLQRATIEERQIHGDRRGELSTLDDRKSHLATLQDLLGNVEEGYASGDAYSLRQQKDGLEVQVQTLQNAKRFHAGKLAGQIEGLIIEKSELPAETDLAKLESDISAYELNKAAIETKSEELEELEATRADYEWTREALGVYKEATSGEARSGTSQYVIVLALLSLAGTVASGLAGLTIPLIASAILSLVFAVIYLIGSKKALSSAGLGKELKRLKTEYHARFGTELTDRAALQAKLEELNRSQILATPLRETLDELSAETRALERKISGNLRAWTAAEVFGQEWRDVIRRITGEISHIDGRIGSARQKLTAAGVPEDQYLDEDPGQVWDPERYATLEEDMRQTEVALRQEEDSLELLKARVSQATGLEGSGWEELITALRNERDMAADGYRQLTSEILAKIQVNAVIEELRQEENSRISDGLKKPELTEPLRALTGRYQSIRLDEDKGLVLVSASDEEYPLADMSTGVREQVFLALRMGFASIAMEGQTGFLILDDAFQHSDWNRRQNLVDHTLSFVQSGWQVIYFTMDDHIRDLFQAAGETLGDRFRSCELG